MKQLFSILIFLASFALSNAQLPATWITVPVPTTKNLTCIDFPSDQVGYIGGEDSLLLKTTDGGLTWNEVNYSGIFFYPSGDRFVGIDFVSENIGFATVGPYSGAYKTLDGGLTWTALNTTESLCYNDALYFFSEALGYVGGSGCFQGEQMDIFTSDGVIQAEINAPTNFTNDMIVDMDFDSSSSEAYGIAVSAGGRILRTTNAGFTWDNIPSPLGNQVPLTSVGIVHSNLAFIGYDSNAASNVGFPLLGLLVSVDGGQTWYPDINSATFGWPKANDIHVTSSGRAYCGQTADPNMPGFGNIIELIDAEENPVWNSFVVEQQINSMSSYGDTIVWGAGNNGYLVRRGPAEVLSTNDKSSSSSMRVFPNPTNSLISADLPSDWMGTNFQMEVISIDGSIVKKGLTGSSAMSVEELSAGIYVIRISGENGTCTSSFIKQ